MYYVPTKVYFGTDAESHIGEALTAMGVKKVLLHYGGGSIKKTGLYDKVTGQLKVAGIEWVDFGGVEPNPKLSMVREGIALGLALNVDPWEAVVKNLIPEKQFPMGLVLTISAAGSEMSNSCVITDAEHNLKRACNHDMNRPALAFMNPENTLTVPPYQTAAGVVDIMMHTMERYLTNEPDTPLTDGIAEAVLASAKDCGTRLMRDPGDLDARSDMMWASSLAHNDITGCGRNKTFPAHKIEHDLSGAHDNITHGAGLAVVFPAWCRFEYKRGIDRFYKWAVNVWQAEPGEDKEKTILEGIGKMVSYFKSLGMPTTMGELGITPAEYEHIAGLTTNGDTTQLLSYGRTIGRKEIIEIYRLAE